MSEVKWHEPRCTKSTRPNWMHLSSIFPLTPSVLSPHCGWKTDRDESDTTATRRAPFLFLSLPLFLPMGPFTLDIKDKLVRLLVILQQTEPLPNSVTISDYHWDDVRHMQCIHHRLKRWKTTFLHNEEYWTIWSNGFHERTGCLSCERSTFACSLSKALSQLVVYPPPAARPACTKASFWLFHESQFTNRKCSQKILTRQWPKTHGN